MPLDARVMLRVIVTELMVAHVMILVSVAILVALKIMKGAGIFGKMALFVLQC
jgi:hypothetical protein